MISSFERSALRVTRFVAFVLQFAVVDALLRGDFHFDPHRFVTSLPGVMASAALWTLAASWTERRWMRAAVALAASWIVVVQTEYFRYYHTFLDDQGTACARAMWADVEPVVVRMLPWTALGAGGLAVVEYWLLLSAPKPSRRLAFAAVLGFAIGVALAPSVQRVPPDLTAFWSVRSLLEPKQAQAHAGVRLPPLQSRRTTLPNVLFILDESVRERDYTTRGPAATAPEAAKLFPDRIDLRQLRSIGSYTSVSVTGLLTGHVPLGTHDELARTPILFDYLRATRVAQRRPLVVYWSSQGESVFARSNMSESVDSFRTDRDLAGRAVQDLEETIDMGMDGRLADTVERDARRLERPLFLMTHLVGTHAPYYVDDAHAPFRPYSHVVNWEGLGKLHNAYLDALVVQDQFTARIAKAFLAAVGSEPYLVVFTSDHGESFGEHSAIHHGQDLYDEQIHVPGWIAFGNGALEPNEAAALRGHADDMLTLLDLLPTLLDAYGVLDSLGLERQRRDFAGRSLLRPFEAAPAAIPLTNCTSLFPCPLNTWGMLEGDRELLAQPWDGAWRCLDLTHVDRELPLAEPGCARLRAASRRTWDRLPNGAPNR